MDDRELTPHEDHSHVRAQPAPDPLPKPDCTANVVPPGLPIILRSDTIPERFLAMKCPGCAGDVQVGERSRELHCGGCGANLVVERKDCTIALRLAASLLNGTAATVAAVPPGDTEEELRKLKAEAAMVANVKRSAGILGWLCGLAFAYMGITDMRAQHLAMGGAILICGSALLGTVVCITRHTIKAHAELTARIRAIAASQESAS